MTDLVIVGAGFGGLYQLYRAREAGLSVRVIEAADGVGGTWYWNRYPGARCDVESLSYSYSFSPELEQEWTWSEKYAGQPEILSYLEHVADRFDLRRDITFSTSVTAVVLDEDTLRWTVTTDAGETIDTRFVVMATGCLSMMKAPEVPGAERFGGDLVHTGSWPHEGVDVRGRRVAVIGTGSSGIQSIPLLAQDAASLTVFQRTPNYSMPAFNRPLSDEEVAERKANYRQWREAQRWSGFGVPLPLPTESALAVPEELRNAQYEQAWGRGMLTAFSSSYTDIRSDLTANDTAAEFIRQKIRHKVDDPAVAETLAPRDHPLGTKRPCLDSGYYETYNADHVELVDLRETPLVEITADGVATTAREYPADVIVLATGFDAMTGALTGIDIRGRGGESLAAKWSAGPRTYLGLAMAGFPNLFTVTGPMSPSVLSNMVVSIEQHVDWITDAIATVRQRGVAGMEATAQAEDAWVDRVAEIAAGTLFPRANSWYMGANVPGKPRVFLAFAGGVGVYRQICDDVVAEDYEGFTLHSTAAR